MNTLDKSWAIGRPSDAVGPWIGRSRFPKLSKPADTGNAALSPSLNARLDPVAMEHEEGAAPPGAERGGTSLMDCAGAEADLDRTTISGKAPPSRTRRWRADRCSTALETHSGAHDQADQGCPKHSSSDGGPLWPLQGARAIPTLTKTWSGWRHGPRRI